VTLFWLKTGLSILWLMQPCLLCLIELILMLLMPTLLATLVWWFAKRITNLPEKTPWYCWLAESSTKDRPWWVAFLQTLWLHSSEPSLKPPPFWGEDYCMQNENYFWDRDLATCGRCILDSNDATRHFLFGSKESPITYYVLSFLGFTFYGEKLAVSSILLVGLYMSMARFGASIERQWNKKWSSGAIFASCSGNVYVYKKGFFGTISKFGMQSVAPTWVVLMCGRLHQHSFTSESSLDPAIFDNGFMPLSTY
jgi:hypothetical protein